MMNSGRNNPYSASSEISGETIKHNLRGLRRERTVRLEEAGAWSGDPFEQLREAMSPGAWAPDVGDELPLTRVFIGRDGEVSFDAVTDQLRDIPTFEWPPAHRETVSCSVECQGIVNDPRAPRGSGKSFAQMAVLLAENGIPLEDIIAFYSGGRRRLRARDFEIFNDWQVVPHDVDLSPHPGERHRQLSRNLTSRRSRAGRAARWA